MNATRTVTTTTGTFVDINEENDTPRMSLEQTFQALIENPKVNSQTRFSAYYDDDDDSDSDDDESVFKETKYYEFDWDTEEEDDEDEEPMFDQLVNNPNVRDSNYYTKYHASREEE